VSGTLGAVPDLTVNASETRTIPGDVVVAGWIDVLGELRCTGDLTCLGITIAPGGTVRCKNLIANVVEIDGMARVARLAAASVRARFASFVQVYELPPLDVEYVHHAGGDPSFGYEGGDRSILREEHDAQFLRRELCAGRNPFAKGELVVELDKRTPPAATPRVIVHPARRR